MGKNRFSILHTDVLSAFKTMPDNSYHGCLTDPPYGLSFMGHGWDHGVPSVDVWRELLRVLRPGAHVLAFGGTRTFHRLTCAIEDAGFEIRDCMMWLYGCLSDDTEVLVDGRWEHYSKATTGRLALCYDVANGTYSWQPIAERVEYDYDETAYRITSDRTDQIVSRNHRCIVDRGAGWEFSLAEEAARESAVRVPVLQDVQGLLCQLRHELGSQAVRGEGFTTSDLAVIEPVHYTGKVWCLRVPTGAFVARRNGKVFVTGNSGFPKSHDVSKAIDREAGATREVIGPSRANIRADLKYGGNDPAHNHGRLGAVTHPPITAPSTSAARQWSGHGTALKPAWEPIIVARKPLDGTVAQNVQRWGCGGLAIDACRIEVIGKKSEGGRQSGGVTSTSDTRAIGAGIKSGSNDDGLGRWPANVILDEEAGQVLDAQSGNRKSASNTKPSTGGTIMSGLSGEARTNGYRAFADGNPYRGEEGGASRFFQSCDFSRDEVVFSRDEVVFSRAMAILNGCSFDHASIANAHSHQPKLRADSVLSDAVTLVSHGAIQLLGWTGLSTAATLSESKMLSATLIATILSFDEGSSHEPRRERSFPTGSRASVAQHQRQTDTTTITISHWRSDGSAEPVTFSITPLNSVHGEAGSSRFIYQAKASRAERNAGVEANIHPTVKPLALARYLARLILPPIPDARMVVPFCGSGSEVIGALQAGWSHVDGIDSWDVAVDIARARVKHWSKPVEQLDLTGEE